MNGLAVLRTKQKQYEDAERLFHEALEARKLKLGEDHPATLESKNDLAMLYKEQARYEEAEKLFLEAVEGRHVASKTTANTSCGRVTLYKHNRLLQELKNTTIYMVTR